MYLVWGKGRASDNGYKAHHNRTPLNSICRIGNKPCLVYLGSHTRPHNSHTEIASREQTEKLPCETCFLELSVPLSPQRGRKNFFSREKDGKSGLSFSKGNDRSVEIGQSRGLADTSGNGRKTKAERSSRFPRTRASGRDKVSWGMRWDFTGLARIDSGFPPIGAQLLMRAASGIRGWRTSGKRGVGDLAGELNLRQENQEDFRVVC